MKLSDIKKLNLPKTPGCYQFFNQQGEIIYIGKAANLLARVSSYWRPGTEHTPAKEAMVANVRAIKFIEVDSEVEAFLLEANLIKKYQPYYNILLRDDKRHAYIKVSTEEAWPRVYLTRTVDQSGTYFGPFVSTEAVKEVLKIIRKIWPYRSCTHLPKKACLYYRIGKCPGMCEAKITVAEYQIIIKDIILFLEGRKKDIVRQLEKELKILLKKKQPDEAEQNRIGFLQYQLRQLRQVLGNAQLLSVGDKYANDVVELAKILQLSKVPQRIEGFDIANIFGKHAVGSMVVFAGGEADKSQYRKFKIQTSINEANDVKMLKEILERRLRHSLPGAVEPWLMPDLIVVDGGKGQLNVVLRVIKKMKLDINAISISKGAGLRSSIARDKIFFPGQALPLVLPLASPALHLIKRVRDEAHRFAIGFHRDLRSRGFLR